MAKVCAYCGSTTNKLTREHIWPSAFLKRLPTYSRRFSARAKRVISGEMTISDVCSLCNNGRLSELDAYAAKLHDRYFTTFYERGQSVQFVYDWNMLGRWLLKMSYNASRASDAPEPALANSASVVLGNEPPDLAVWLDLAEPSYYEQKSRTGKVIRVKRVPPAMTRLCRMAIPNFKLEHYVLRLVVINAFYFYVAIPVTPYGPVYWDEMTRIAEFFSLMACLDCEETSVVAKTTGLTTDHLIRPHFHVNGDLYREFDLRQAMRENPNY